MTEAKATAWPPAQQSSVDDKTLSLASRHSSVAVQEAVAGVHPTAEDLDYQAGARRGAAHYWPQMQSH